MISTVRAIEAFTIRGALYPMIEEPHAVRMHSVYFSLYLHVTVKALKIAPARPPHSCALTNLASALRVSAALLGRTLDYLPQTEMYVCSLSACFAKFVCGEGERDVRMEDSERKARKLRVREGERKRRREGE